MVRRRRKAPRRLRVYKETSRPTNRVIPFHRRLCRPPCLAPWGARARLYLFLAYFRPRDKSLYVGPDLSSDILARAVPCPYGSHAGYFRQRGAESPRISLSRNNFSTGDQVVRNERWKWNGLRREDIAFLVKRNCSILSHEFCTKLKGIA